MQLTRQADYAARAVLYLATSPKASIGKISTEQGIPQEYLFKIVQALSRAGIVTTHRGAGGGVSLARPPEKISLLDVVEAIEGPVVLNRCFIKPKECPREGFCSIHDELLAVQESLRRQLAAIDFAGMATRERLRRRRLEKNSAGIGY